MPDEVMTITKLLAVTFWKQCWWMIVKFFCNRMPHRLVIDVVEAKGFCKTSHMRTLIFKFYKIHECFKQAIFRNFLQKRIQILNIFHDKWVSVTTAWRILRLRMEERPPIWKVAVTILNKQLGTADKGWSSMYLGPGLIFWHSLSNGKGERPRRRWEENIKMDPQAVGWGAWTGFIWLRTGTSGGLL